MIVRKYLEQINTRQMLSCTPICRQSYAPLLDYLLVLTQSGVGLVEGRGCCSPLSGSVSPNVFQNLLMCFVLPFGILVVMMHFPNVFLHMSNEALLLFQHPILTFFKPSMIVVFSFQCSCNNLKIFLKALKKVDIFLCLLSTDVVLE